MQLSVYILFIVWIDSCVGRSLSIGNQLQTVWGGFHHARDPERHSGLNHHLLTEPCTLCLTFWASDTSSKQKQTLISKEEEQGVALSRRVLSKKYYIRLGLNMTN